jgi:hypothetical protein
MGGAALIFDNLGINMLSLIGKAPHPSLLYLNRNHGEEIEAELVPVVPERIWDQGRPSHGGDKKTVPAGGDTGEYQPVGSGKNRAGQQTGADGQGVVLECQMNPHIHGTEKIADTVALHAVKAGGGIQHQYFEFMFVVQHLKCLLEAPCGCECDWPTSFQRLK